ncbi:hypothetical protein GOARA_056_01060 [Gordonia araii NBRC 100433]|uniref:DUF3027 domain-containing protein n=1 Tax=Gordonia araii NBRC 100433 TaxID=1073574 RepID=G7H3D3_9ACTN|nr:DUF3027 domain-containing protein [Gordonia araii]GAB10358.1 hypothetical protein GOARA_056_01060 [Gordonia araii NBRC 100433]
MSLTAQIDLLRDAVDLARGAVVADGGAPGDHIEAVVEDDNSAAHYFAADLPGYRGWRWCVVVAVAPGSDDVTVSEVVLLPGDGALLAPAWVPWSERVAAGDLAPGDLLAAEPDDPRLVPNQIDNGDAAAVDGELGLGRKRLLSPEGRADAAQRWYDGEYGPGSPMAEAAKHKCEACGFFLPLAGALRFTFGVCANEYSADGHVVSVEYGCGAHSDVAPKPPVSTPAFDPFDDGILEVFASAD